MSETMDSDFEKIVGIAKLIAESLGYDLGTLYPNKRAWVEDRGARHDINTPYQHDLIDAARALLPLIAQAKEEGAAEMHRRCKLAAEGPVYLERYRGTEAHHWSAERHYSNPYGNARMDAAAAIEALPLKEQNDGQ